jgi:Ca-activated chloride channel family protein
MLSQKFSTILILMLFSSATLFSQAEDKLQVNAKEELPIFPGGDEALFRFISKNIQYPIEAREKNEQGTVYVTFVIETDGSITDVSILKSISSSLDNESIRLVETMPNWKPGTQDGVPVRVQLNLPIRFALKGNDNSKKKEKKKR